MHDGQPGGGSDVVSLLGLSDDVRSEHSDATESENSFTQVRRIFGQDLKCFNVVVARLLVSASHLCHY